MTMFSSFIGLNRLCSFTVKTVLMGYSNRSFSYLCKNSLLNVRPHRSRAITSIHTSCCNFKRRKTAEEKKSHRVIEYAPKSKGEMVGVWKDMTVKDLANVLDQNVNYIQEIFQHKVIGANTVITDMKLLQQAIKNSGHRMKIVAKPSNKREEEIIEKDAFPRSPAAKSELKPRPPVVTVMGHVDHGKTTLLDALRHSSVVEQEFGGITQHIGAFSVVLDSGARITFLDTPGHAAFSAMRARGAFLTDIVVLVVAADDGVMEQTVESIRMAREAKVPILVAINKIDSPKADIDRTEQMLVSAGIQVEKLGGDIQAIPISALKKQNLEQLTEALVLQADLLEIGAAPTGPVEAVVVESKVHPHRGKQCTVVVQRGTLKRGNVLVAGTVMGKVRALKDAEGNSLDEVLPGYPAEIDGWKDLPSPGDQVLQVDTEKRARDVVRIRLEQKEAEKSAKDYAVISEKREHYQNEYKEQLLTRRRMGRFKSKPEGPRKPEIPKDDDPTPSLNLVVKGDVDGSLEALLDTLDTYDDSERCKMDLVHYGVGGVTENDVELAQAFKALIYAFNVNYSSSAVKELADMSNVTVKFHNVIYKLVDDVKSEINSRLLPTEVEEILGEAVILQLFDINVGRHKVPVAGCRCTKGLLRKTAMYRITRGDQVIFTGQLAAMKHLKNDVDVIKTDIECGLQFMDKGVTFQAGDVLVCFQKKTQPQITLWDPGF